MSESNLNTNTTIIMCCTFWIYYKISRNVAHFLSSFEDKGQLGVDFFSYLTFSEFLIFLSIIKKYQLRIMFLVVDTG